MNRPIKSILNVGADGIIVEVECQLSNGLPSMIIVGLGNKAIDEAKERIRSAFVSTKLQLPRKRITINLAPADMPKNSTSFDVAIAAAILSQNQKQKSPLDDTACIGEIGLDGAVKPVRGVVGKLLCGKKLGVTSFLIPVGNLLQASLIPGIRLLPIANITELASHVANTRLIPEIVSSGDTTSTPSRKQNSLAPFSHVIGQEAAKRALCIAAAGNHNILLSGPPGTGKSMLAKTLPLLLPALSHEEMLEITHLHSLVSHNYEALVAKRPFRAPHHSASHTSIVGGGPSALPGEITLSHRGVLFLDELPEFGRTTLEALRQPLEDKVITIARSKQTVTYPADFMLIATANPCPCGFYGSSRECICTVAQIRRYQQRVSGPIADRIDLFVHVQSIDHKALLSVLPESNEESPTIKIEKARVVQQERFKTYKSNATMDNEELRKHARLDTESAMLLSIAATKLHLSARAYMKVVKVARTIADLEESMNILPEHISEALQYRKQTIN